VIITAGILAAAFIVSLGALSIKDAEDEPTPTPTPTPSADVTGSPDANATTTQITGSTPACTSEAPADRAEAQLLVAFDELDDASLTEGAAVLGIDETEPRQGTGSLKVDVGQREAPATIRAPFDEPVDVQGGEVGLWMRQNGGLYTGGLDWVIRMGSDGTNSFEQVLQPIDVTAAIQWCHFSLDVADLRVIGHPDPSQIRFLEVDVPGYAGAGAGNTIWLDGVSFG